MVIKRVIIRYHLPRIGGVDIFPRVSVSGHPCPLFGVPKRTHHHSIIDVATPLYSTSHYSASTFRTPPSHSIPFTKRHTSSHCCDCGNRCLELDWPLQSFPHDARSYLGQNGQETQSPLDIHIVLPAQQSPAILILRIHTHSGCRGRMPPRLEMPLLSVHAEKMRRIDTRNVDNLFGLWTGEDHRALPYAVIDADY